MLNILWQMCDIIGLIFIASNGQILKNNLTIWSHCYQLTSIFRHARQSRTTCLGREEEIPSPAYRVTRFGKILQLWQYFKSFGHTCMGLLSVLQNFEHTLAIFYVVGQIFITASDRKMNNQCSHLATLLLKLTYFQRQKRDFV